MSIKSNVEYKSQVGQDKCVIEEIFKGMTNGYFVDIGAADGLLCSNTYVLEKEYQWDGLCIEPNSVSFEKLKLTRKCDLDNSFVLDDRGGEIDFHEYIGSVHQLLFSSMNPHAPYANNPHVVEQVRKVKPVPLAEVLSKHNLSNVIHYMSIDVEGAEYDLIHNFFVKCQGKVPPDPATKAVMCLSIEHNFRPDREKIRELLETLPVNRFVYYKQLMQDDIYINADFINLLKI